MCLKSSVKFPQSMMIWAAMSSAGVGPLCFLKSTVNAAIYQEILDHFMLPSADKLYGDADFIFKQDLAPAHTVKGTKSWFNSIQFKFICIALFTIQSLQSALQEIKFLQYIYTL